jgi:hypothetical protein
MPILMHILPSSGAAHYYVRGRDNWDLAVGLENLWYTLHISGNSHGNVIIAPGVEEILMTKENGAGRVNIHICGMEDIFPLN